MRCQKISSVKDNKSTNSGKRWTEQEEEIMMTHLNNGKSVLEISTILQRTKFAITCRLQKLALHDHEVNNVDIDTVLSKYKLSLKSFEHYKNTEDLDKTIKSSRRNFNRNNNENEKNNENKKNNENELANNNSDVQQQLYDMNCKINMYNESLIMLIERMDNLKRTIQKDVMELTKITCTHKQGNIEENGDNNNNDTLCIKCIIS
ncbi:hypothetical protein [Heterosigma akashiwo virus 01]|jgi:hypothetical protein|uniref:Myb-like domain-containing protein n=1 Tax=Heterosigma akashiwo virus 01 TaxID=97195 RepID=A0A1C9C5A8_HAV01|nr:hypothetical protein D1R72_gp135 [Heterosigma akashiwo virus 01]AOM63466.1 hypothetical protein [Heterosigma akashiwo virus 01]